MWVPGRWGQLTRHLGATRVKSLFKANYQSPRSLQELTRHFGCYSIWRQVLTRHFGCYSIWRQALTRHLGATVFEVGNFSKKSCCGQLTRHLGVTVSEVGNFFQRYKMQKSQVAAGMQPGTWGLQVIYMRKIEVKILGQRILKTRKS